MTEPGEEWRDLKRQARGVMLRRWVPLVVLALLVVAATAAGVSRCERPKYCIRAPC